MNTYRNPTNIYGPGAALLHPIESSEPQDPAEQLEAAQESLERNPQHTGKTRLTKSKLTPGLVKNRGNRKKPARHLLPDQGC